MKTFNNKKWKSSKNVPPHIFSKKMKKQFYL